MSSSLDTRLPSQKRWPEQLRYVNYDVCVYACYILIQLLYSVANVHIDKTCIIMSEYLCRIQIGNYNFLAVNM